MAAVKTMGWVAILSLGLMVLGCSTNCLRGSGTVVREKREIARFENVVLDLPAVVNIKHTPEKNLVVETDDNLISQINTRVADGTLYIESTKKNCCLAPTVLQIGVNAQNVKDLSIDGSGSITVNGPVQREHVRYDIDGSGKITLKQPVTAELVDFDIDGSGKILARLESTRAQTSIDGSGDITLSGKLQQHNVDINGSGALNAENLLTKDIVVDMDGSGVCDFGEVEILDVSIDGSGDIFYRGNPKKQMKINGSGSVRHR